MGKAAERRKARRKDYLARLASKNPERFLKEWNRRMDSWIHEVWRRAALLVDENGNRVAPAFEVIDVVREILDDCGIREDFLPDHCSIDVLINECCKALALQIDGRMYHLHIMMDRHLESR